MTLDQAAIFFVGSILFMLGLTVIAVGAVVINNIFSKYWRTVRIFWPYHSVEEFRNEHTEQSSGSKEDRTSVAGDKQQSNKG
jgi:hypothetical protein